MEKMGFGNKWLNWIRWCISTTTFLVLVNGTSTDFSWSSKGLRQVDPLSPYLFVLEMEAPSCLLSRAMEGTICKKVGCLSSIVCRRHPIVLWGRCRSNGVLKLVVDVV